MAGNLCSSPTIRKLLAMNLLKKALSKLKYPVKRCFFYTLLALAFACRGKQAAEVPAQEMTITGESPYQYRVTGNLLILRANWMEVADTVELDFDGSDPFDLKVTDVSDSLQFSHLVLQVSFTGWGDTEYNEFYAFRGDSLKLLFSICNLVKIKRQDANTLTGFTTDRDEVVYHFQDDYPFVVMLAEGTVVHYKPDRQYIGFDSEALDNIAVYRLTEQQDTIPFTIEKGTKVKVDSINRLTNTVRLLVRDSIPVYVPKGELYEKLQSNAAG
jgi:hypothetical protein